MSPWSLAVPLALVLTAPQDSAPSGAPRWSEVLGPSQGELPPPRDEIVWRTDLGAAFALARAEDRPLLVTLRCLPCKQCSSFDKSVLEGGPELDPWLQRFVTVRLTDVAGLDLALFPLAGFQDLDLSWWGWFLSPEGRVYGVFGGRDEVSDESRISVPALERALERVLRHHADPRRPSWDVDGPLPDRQVHASTPETLPGHASWARRTAAEERTSCLHCHQVAEILRQPAIDAGTFDKQRDLEPWPLPENLGITVERDDGRRIGAVIPASPAARAGLAPGDEVLVADGRLVFGQSDLRAALHRAGHGPTTVTLLVRRADALLESSLPLAPGWKRTILDWRMSVSQGNVGAHPGFWPGAGSEGDRERWSVPAEALCLRPWFGPSPSGPAFEAGLRPEHLIVAVDGQRPALSGRPFLVWFRKRIDPGDEVRLLVRDGEREREIVYRP